MGVCCLEVGDRLLGFDEIHETVVGDKAGPFDLSPLTEAESFDRSIPHELIKFGPTDAEKFGRFIHPNILGLPCLCWIGINH